MNLHRILEIQKGLPPSSLYDMLISRKIGKSNTLTSTVSGYPCILENSVEKPVVDYKIYGNSIQDETPSSDNPVEIQSVGELVTEGEFSGKYKIPIVSAGTDGRTEISAVYLDEPLRKIGDYADVIDFERGIVERNVKKINFTSNLDWKLQGINTYGIANFYIQTNTIGELLSLTNRFSIQKTGIVSTTNEGYRIVSEEIYIRILQSRASSVAEFKKWLDENPTYIEYAIAEPITESINLPKSQLLRVQQQSRPTRQFSRRISKLLTNQEEKQMIKTFKSADKTQITAHFAISEFKCKCGGSHDTKLDTTLVDNLEKLRTALNCSKIVINSGYRCASHDKAVGGSGAGYHTTGYAADIICYDQSGNKISSKKVSCAAQDVGFGGIANIDSTYTATHVDTRTSNYWKGDEVKTTAYSVTDDFYKYYGLSKSDVYPASAKKTKNITFTIDGVTYSGNVTEK